MSTVNEMRERLARRITRDLTEVECDRARDALLLVANRVRERQLWIEHRRDPAGILPDALVAEGFELIGMSEAAEWLANIFAVRAAETKRDDDD